MGCFRLPKEIHKVLKWVFSRIKILNVLKAQEEGKELYIDFKS